LTNPRHFAYSQHLSSIFIPFFFFSEGYLVVPFNRSPLDQFERLANHVFCLPLSVLEQ